MEAGGRKPGVALVQLPVPDPDPAGRRANVPLAAGYLKAYAGQEEPGGADIRLLPAPLARWGGDQAVLGWLREGRFSLAGFTAYLWNSERSLWLAGRLKEADPAVRTLFGGPEAEALRPAGRAPGDARAPDVLVPGEGELPFLAALRDLRAGRPLAPLYRAPEWADLARLPNPYLAGALAAREDEPLYLETQRGCPWRCAYCFYGKSFARSPDGRRRAPLRFFPADVVEGVFRLAREKGVPEIYLMDPSFGASPSAPAGAGAFEEKLLRIRAANPGRLPLHTELRLEAVTPRIARLLAEAGFVSVEVGLQSTNREALREVRRSWERERFRRGARLLLEQGLAVRTGIILGLPHDGLEQIEATLEFVIECGLAEGLEAYPLALLPGTELRRRAGALGLSGMGFPPWWVLRTDRLAEPDLFRAVRLVEERLGIDFHPPILPRFDDPDPSLAGFLDLRRPGAVQRLLDDPPPLANVLTLLLPAAPAGEELLRLGRRLREREPFALLQLVLDGDPAPPVEEGLRLAAAFDNPAHPFDRTRYFQEDPQGRFSTRLFHLTGDPRGARRDRRRWRFYDPILRYAPLLLGRGLPLLRGRPPLLLEGPPGKEEEARLRELYRGHESLLLRVPGPRRG